MHLNVNLSHQTWKTLGRTPEEGSLLDSERDAFGVVLESMAFEVLQLNAVTVLVENDTSERYAGASKWSRAERAAFAERLKTYILMDHTVENQQDHGEAIDNQEEPGPQS